VRPDLQRPHDPPATDRGRVGRARGSHEV
jgi:hypothetical protein